MRLNSNIKGKMHQYFIRKIGAFDYRKGWMKSDCPYCGGEKKFGINTQRSFPEYKRILLEHAHEDLAAVLDARKAERNDPDAELEDSIFFFPLAGGLNRLSYYISNQQ